jgi:predicted O-methyltransferase YrrM
MNIAFKLLGRLPNSIKFLVRQVLKQFNLYIPPGHYYSPIPDIKEIKKNEAKIFNCNRKSLPAIDLNIEKQSELTEQFKLFQNEPPWNDDKQKGYRYYYNNSFFGKNGAHILFYLMRILKPKNIIEVGSGFSSAVMLDTNEQFFQNKINLTFIEPYPDRLKSLLQKNDNVEIVQKNIQEVPLDTFLILKENDFLFIDSSHVVKTGSDLNYIFFEILPALNNGVYIHFHDIHHFFEYPKKWVYEGRAWNEAYFLRAFLQYNNAFEVTFFDGNSGSFWMKKK